MKTDREKMKMLEKTLKTNLSKRVKFIEPKKSIQGTKIMKQNSLKDEKTQSKLIKLKNDVLLFIDSISE